MEEASTLTHFPDQSILPFRCETALLKKEAVKSYVCTQGH